VKNVIDLVDFVEVDRIDLVGDGATRS